MTSTERGGVDGVLTPRGRQTRERILQAARECFTRFGVKKTSVSDIAQAAGLSRAAVYQHFAEKAEIVEAAAESAATDYYRRMARTLDGAVGLQEQLTRAAVFVTRSRALLEQMHPWFESEPIAMIFTTHAQRLLRKGVVFFAYYLEAGIERGEIRPDVDVIVAGEGFTRMLFSLFSTPSPHLDLEDPAVLEKLVSDCFVRGITRHR